MSAPLTLCTATTGTNKGNLKLPGIDYKGNVVIQSN